VEFFVQTEASLMRFCEDDRVRRRPTTMRLVGSSIVLMDNDGSGQRLQSLLRRMDDDGPPPVSADVLEAMRYAASDMLEAEVENGYSMNSSHWMSTWTPATRPHWCTDCARRRPEIPIRCATPCSPS
jgi:hypothetical protein